MDGSIDIWKFIAGSLLIVLGWVLGWKNASKSHVQKAESWDIERQAILLRIKQLEDMTAQRSEHPEFHPLSNYMNGKLGQFSNELKFLKKRMDDYESR